MSLLGNLENEIDSTGEALKNDVETVITEVEHPAILTEVHAFFDAAKTKIVDVFDDIVTSAKSKEEAIENLILAAIGKAADETRSIVAEVASS